MKDNTRNVTKGKKLLSINIMDNHKYNNAARWAIFYMLSVIWSKTEYLAIIDYMEDLGAEETPRDIQVLNSPSQKLTTEAKIYNRLRKTRTQKIACKINSQPFKF